MSATRRDAVDAVPALRIRGLSKSFEGTSALRAVDLDLRLGEIHALVGENGSGKSTLVKILAGVHDPDPGGSVEVGGVPLAGGGAAGLRFVHQDLGLVGALSITDNLALGPGFHTGPTGWISWPRERATASRALATLGYDHIDVRAPVDSLSMSERTAVAVTRALSHRHGTATVLVLDEPTANLPAPEIDHLFSLVETVAASGIAVLFISHHFGEVFRLAQRVTVLRDGAVVRTDDTGELTEDRLVELMTGRAPASSGVRAGEDAAGTEVLRAEGIAGPRVAGVDLAVRAGEIVGIAGITGSGRENLVRLLAGDLERTGHLQIGETTVPGHRPDAVIAAGGAYVPARRVANALLIGMPVRTNLTISHLTSLTRGGLLDRGRENREVDETLARFDVRPRRGGAEIGTLSGGNQQKVVLARALRRRPRVLLLDEPTQGVDVGAQHDLHGRIRALAGSGAGVVVACSSSDELAELADRVLVMVEGRVVRELRRPLDPDSLTAACLSATEGGSR
ncbi:sugar ABC transporter ATP-binding protein [Pseudonocardia sp. RS010]|uniref:sugar ABC transporter ATP-binding protein n=1 Tax=Pseudonocardia sp. RS010 TaxID=3385979 RepID=UPI0039A3ADA5